MSSADLYQRIQADLRRAVVRGDRVAVAALRTAVAAVDNAGAVPADHAPDRGAITSEVARRRVDDDAIRELIRAEMDERRAAIHLYEDLGRHRDAQRLREEAAVLMAYL